MYAFSLKFFFSNITITCLQKHLIDCKHPLAYYGMVNFSRCVIFFSKLTLWDLEGELNRGFAFFQLAKTFNLCQTPTCSLWYELVNFFFPKLTLWDLVGELNLGFVFFSFVISFSLVGKGWYYGHWSFSFS